MGESRRGAEALAHSVLCQRRSLLMARGPARIDPTIPTKRMENQ
jgi:hypothetical protein